MCHRSGLRVCSALGSVCGGDLPKVTKCVGGSPLTQENHLVVVSGVTGTHSNANAAYKYTSTSRLFQTRPGQTGEFNFLLPQGIYIPEMSGGAGREMS